MAEENKQPMADQAADQNPGAQADQAAEQNPGVEPAGKQQAGGKLFTQEDVNRIAAREAKEAQEKLLKQLGIEDFESAKEGRSEEHTSELQSRENLVCRLLLEKK